MAAITHLHSLDFITKILDKDRDWLEAIIVNDDNLTCDAFVTIHTGSDEAITALKDMLTAARATERAWREFLKDFISVHKPLERFKSRAGR